MITPEAILSFPSLITPRPRSEGGPEVYSCSLLFSAAAQKTPEFAKLKAACEAAAKERFDGKVPAGLKLPFRDGSEKDYAGYAGTVYISPWSKQKPGIVDENVEPLLDLDRLYPGVIVRADIKPFAWAVSGNKGVSFGLNHLQIVRDGERMDGKSSPSSVFSPVGGDDTPF
jgi:hypothetical protein